MRGVMRGVKGMVSATGYDQKWATRPTTLSPCTDIAEAPAFFEEAFEERPYWSLITYGGLQHPDGSVVSSNEEARGKFGLYIYGSVSDAHQCAKRAGHMYFKTRKYKSLAAVFKWCQKWDRGIIVLRDAQGNELKTWEVTA